MLNLGVPAAQHTPTSPQQGSTSPQKPTSSPARKLFLVSHSHLGIAPRGWVRWVLRTLGAELAPPDPALPHSPPVPLQVPPSKMEFQMMEGTLERKHVLQAGGRKVRARLRGSFGTGVLGHGGGLQVSGRERSQGCSWRYHGRAAGHAGRAEPTGAGGGILNGRGPLVFSQTHWHHICPLLASCRPTAAPGASSTPC